MGVSCCMTSDGINADQWKTAAEVDDCSPWARWRNKGRDVSSQINRCRESRGWTTGCSGISMPESDGKDQGEESKASVLVLVCSPKLISHANCKLVSPECFLVRRGGVVYLWRYVFLFSLFLKKNMNAPRPSDCFVRFRRFYFIFH